MRQNKRIFIAAAAVCLSLGAAAQQDAKLVMASECQTCGKNQAGVTVFNYIKDEQRHYMVSGCVPGSDVELYSTPSGGEVVATATADEKGEAHFRVAIKTPVFFALNHSRLNDKGIAGNGHTMVFPPAAIQLDDAAANVVSEDLVLSWRATIAAGDWIFAVQKSNDNLHFTDVATIDARDGSTQQGYSYSCKKDEDVAVQYFRVEARDKSGAKVTAAANVVKGNIKSFFSVQPTLFENNLQLAMAQDKLPATYTISDAMGRTKYASGVLNSMRQTINLTVLAGTYILRVTDRKGVSSSQMIIKK